MDILQCNISLVITTAALDRRCGRLPRLREHLYYVLISIVGSSTIALPLGIILGYWRKGAFGDN